MVACHTTTMHVIFCCMEFSKGNYGLEFWVLMFLLSRMHESHENVMGIFLACREGLVPF